jgi:hypothetical protein
MCGVGRDGDRERTRRGHICSAPYITVRTLSITVNEMRVSLQCFKHRRGVSPLVPVHIHLAATRMDVRLERVQGGQQDSPTLGQVGNHGVWVKVRQVGRVRFWICKARQIGLADAFILNN